jgi:hypothetical protein
MEADRMAAVTSMSGEDSSRMTRCLTGGAHLSVARQRHIVTFRAQGLAGPGLASAPGPKWRPRPFLFFCSNYFSFSGFETKSFVLQQNLHRFESLQICNNFKKGQRFWVKYNVEQSENKTKIIFWTRNNNNSHELFAEKFYLKTFLDTR